MIVHNQLFPFLCFRLGERKNVKRQETQILAGLTNP